MRTDDFDYNLPEELIAQEPAAVRDECRLLVMDRKSGEVEDRIFKDIIEYLRPATCSWPTRRGSCRRACSAPSGARAGRPRCFCCASAEAPSRGRTAWPSGRCSCGRASA